MFNKMGIFSNFKDTVHCILSEFKKLGLIEQINVVQLFEKCLDEMQKTIAIGKTSPQCNISYEKNDSYFKSPVKCNISNPLNVLTGSDLNLQETVQEIYSDSEKDDANDLSDSSHSTLQKRVNLIVEKLEHDDAFLNTDMALENSTNSLVDDDIMIDKENEPDNINIKIEEIDKKTSNVVSFEITDESVSQSDSNDEALSEPVVKTGATNFQCALCKKLLMSYISLIEHIFQHAGTKQSCFKCKNTFENMISYDFHLKNNICNADLSLGIEKLKEQSIAKFMCCPYCGKKFCSTFNLRRHVKKACNQNKNLECKLCFRVFLKQESYSEHLQKLSTFVCNKCQKQFCSRSLLSEHRTSVCKSVYMCEICNIIFPTRSVYREHFKKFSADEDHKNIKKPDVWCQPCMMYLEEKSYKPHCKTRNHLQKSKQELPKQKDFICEKCGTGFTDKKALIGHIRKMHQRGPIKCDLCPYSTTTTCNMTRHKSRFHENAPKKFACDKCPTLHGSASKLKEHIIRAHNKEKFHSCNICHKEFKLKNELTQHKRIHNSVFPYSCNHCFMKFRRPAHLERHLFAKHEENVIKKTKDQSMKKSKPQKPTETQPVAETMTNVENEQVYSWMDVQSGELVMMSNMDMLKNYVVNISGEGDLLNNVQLPEIWHNPVGEPFIYSIQGNQIMSDAQETHNTYMPPPENGMQEAQPNLIEGSKDVITEYVPNYMQLPNHKMGMMTNDLLTQGTLDSEMIVNNPNYGNLHSLPMPPFYGDMTS